MKRDHERSLAKFASKALEKSVEERIAYCQDQSIWLPYPGAIKVMNELETLYNYPRVERMPNLLVTGHTNNGKTKVLRQFSKKYPSFVGADGKKVPIIYFKAPISPSENALYEHILDTLRVPYGVNDSASSKARQVREVLKDIDTRMIIVDELQDIGHGSAREQLKFLTAVKQLADDIMIPIVAAGIPKVQAVLRADDQMSNRFETISLDKWRMDKEFGRLLVSIESILPLKEPSNLIAEKMKKKIYFLSEGILGEVFTIVRKTAVYALQHGYEHIELDMFDMIVYHRPSERRK